MSGTSKLTIGGDLQESAPFRGYTEDHSVPLGSWTLGTGVGFAAVGAGIVGRAASSTSLGGIQWDDTADASDTARLDWTLPGQFKSQAVYSDDTPVFKLLVKARVRDGTGSATANTDLALTAQIYFHAVGGTSVSSLSAVVSNVIGATDYADATEEGFAWYTFDLYGAMSTAQKAALRPLDTMDIVLAPDQAVGTDLYIDVIGTVIRYKRHPSLEDNTAR